MRWIAAALCLVFVSCGHPTTTSQQSKGDLDSIKTKLDQAATTIGANAFSDTYGTSLNGHALMYLRIADMTDKPAVWLAGGMHGNEVGGVNVVMDAIDRFATAVSQNDPVVQSILDRYHVYLLPVMNPDGYVAGVREMNGVDGNRELPYPDQPDRSPNMAIRDLISFFEQTKPVAALDFHTSGGLVMTPWGYTRTNIPDQDAMNTMAATLADTAGYESGQISRVLYVAKGNTADYYYWKLKTKAFAVEVGKYGREGDPVTLVKRDYESLWSMVLKLFEVLP